MNAHRYAVALGSNQRHPRHGPPRAVLEAAVRVLADEWRVLAVAPVVDSAPVGPSRRRYANGAVLLEGPHAPPAALDRLQAVEHAFGRRRRGQRWRARPLDLDIVLWSGGAWRSPALIVPHPLFSARPFVLGPVAAVAPLWRDPFSGLTMRQLAARAGARPRPDCRDRRCPPRHR